MANILERIAAETELTKSERKLANLVLKDPASIINENIAQLAKKAGVSEPTVFRFCKRFGADGFPSFKLVLSGLVSKESSSKVESVRQGDTVEDVIFKVLSAGRSSINETEKQLDSNVVAKAIDIVSQSRRIVLFSQGMSVFVTDDFESRLLNLGFICHSYHDRQSMCLCTPSLRSDDVVIAVSSTGRNLDILEAAKLVRNYGAFLITITPQKSPLADLSSLVLSSCENIDISNDSIFQNRMSMMLISQIVVGGVMLRRGMMLKEMKDKLVYVRSKSYLKDKETDETQEEITKSSDDDDTLRPGAPITEINWRY